MNDRPNAIELLDAVVHFLEAEAMPALEGAARFHARVAANVVRSVAYEIESEEQSLLEEWRRLGELLARNEPPPSSREALRIAVRSATEELVRRIRAGEADAGPWRDALLDHLEATVAEKLATARPPRSHSMSTPRPDPASVPSPETRA